MKEKVLKDYMAIQDYICEKLEALDGKAKFVEDLWNRDEGGGGRTRVISNGNVFEKGGVNFSQVYGPVTDLMKKQLKLNGETFFATGVSIVLHPKNPHVPIMHMNIRYFEMDNGEHYWFGGGIDMTPHYIVEEAAKYFHLELKQVCDKYNDGFYQEFKTWADNYFYIPHREETRGVGGIFYDHLIEREGLSKQNIFDFSKDLGYLFPDLYQHQVNLFQDLDFNEQDIKWRNIRRGRYVEFNLVHDRGTQFGLKTGGRIESILMSLPENASWFYNHKPENNAKAQKTLDLLKKDIDWLAFG